MLKSTCVFALVLLLSACAEKPVKRYDAKQLLVDKCASCHNLDLPPKTYEDEKAPPMMAVAFHIKSFAQTQDESQRILKARAFVKDYVMNPSASKSFCDKESLASYGVMPSQKGKLTEDELDAISAYMFERYTQENLTKEQAIQNRLNAMPKGQLLAIKNNCLSCHRVEMKLVGPSFNSMAMKYRNSPETLKNKIRNGVGYMPAFKKLSDEELEEMSKFIFSTAKP